MICYIIDLTLFLYLFHLVYQPKSKIIG